MPPALPKRATPWLGHARPLRQLALSTSQAARAAAGPPRPVRIAAGSARRPRPPRGDGRVLAARASARVARRRAGPLIATPRLRLPRLYAPPADSEPSRGSPERPRRSAPRPGLGDYGQGDDPPTRRYPVSDRLTFSASVGQFPELACELASVWLTQAAHRVFPAGPSGITPAPSVCRPLGHPAIRTPRAQARPAPKEYHRWYRQVCFRVYLVAPAPPDSLLAHRWITVSRSSDISPDAIGLMRMHSWRRGRVDPGRCWGWHCRAHDPDISGGLDCCPIFVDRPGGPSLRGGTEMFGSGDNKVARRRVAQRGEPVTQFSRRGHLARGPAASARGNRPACRTAPVHRAAVPVDLGRPATRTASTPPPSRPAPRAGRPGSSARWTPATRSRSTSRRARCGSWASARVFGFNSWSLLVPQALEGVAAVGLLYAMVRVGGPARRPVAGAILALTPAAALMFRFDNPDALLTLLIVPAAYAITRAIERARPGWLVLGRAALGFCLPHQDRRASCRCRRSRWRIWSPRPPRWADGSRHLLLAGGARSCAAGWWVAAVALWPESSRPYIGGSTDNSVLRAGLRLQRPGPAHRGERERRRWWRRGGGRTSFGGATGLNRLFGGEMGQRDLVAAAGGAGRGVVGLWVTRGAPRTDPNASRAHRLGGWLVVAGLSSATCRASSTRTTRSRWPRRSPRWSPSAGRCSGSGGAKSWAGWRTRPSLWSCW